MAFGGRRMGGILWVDADHCEGEQLDAWIDFALRFVGELPPK